MNAYFINAHTVLSEFFHCYHIKKIPEKHTEYYVYSVNETIDIGKRILEKF